MSLSRVLGCLSLATTAIAVPFLAACGKTPADPLPIQVRSPPADSARDATIPEGKQSLSRQGEPKLTPEACHTLHREAARALAESRIQHDAPCKTDAECVMVPTDACRSGGDCGGMPMSKSGEAAVRAKATELGQTTCAKWNGGGCPTIAPLPTPSCPAREPACIDGHCATRSPR